MGKKARVKGGDKGGDKEKDGVAASEDVKREQKLQAIILADSFTKTFRPMTREMPKVLLPLANVPMLECTIEFLARNGVQELFVFCVSHADQVRQYIENSRWLETIDVHCISSTSCMSAGDVLREMDSMAVIRSDPFILISGDVISNMNLQDVMKFHRERRATDNCCVMTCVMKEAAHSSGVRGLLDDLVLGLDAHTGQILLYENDLSSGSTALPLEVYDAAHIHPNIVFTDKLMDTHVDICSPDLLIKYSDNFDYQDMRRDFIVNEITNIELGSHIYCWTLEDEYAARVMDLKTYHTICQDIVNRWVYPLVPDTNLCSINTTRHTHDLRCVYKEDGFRVQRNTTIGPSVVIGSGTIVSEGSMISHSTIGRNCFIGPNVRISYSNVWSNVRVEAGSTLEHCCVCNGVNLRKGCLLSRGSVVSFNCIIGEGVIVPEFTRISMYRGEGENTSEAGSKAEAPRYDVEVVGEDGRGYVWIGEVGEENDDKIELSVEVAPLDFKRARSMGCTREMLWGSQLWTVPPIPDDDDDDEGSTEAEDPGKGFVQTIRELVVHGHSRGDSHQNLLVDIRSFKYAQNREFSECLKGVVFALLDTTGGSTVSTRAEAAKFVIRLKEAVRIWLDVLTDLRVRREDEIAIIESLEEYTEVCQQVTRESLVPVFRYILQIFNDSGMVSEETWSTWIKQRRAGGGSTPTQHLLFHNENTQEFVQWLEADEEEDEEDEEEGDEDEEEETTKIEVVD